MIFFLFHSLSIAYAIHATSVRCDYSAFYWLQSWGKLAHERPDLLSNLSITTIENISEPTQPTLATIYNLEWRGEFNPRLAAMVRSRKKGIRNARTRENDRTDPDHPPKSLGEGESTSRWWHSPVADAGSTRAHSLDTGYPARRLTIESTV